LAGITILTLFLSGFSGFGGFGESLMAAMLKPGGRNSLTVSGPGFNGNPALRDLRTDFVQNWHIFADTLNDAILDPGDTRVKTFKNWWTSVSAATQHQYEIGGPPAAGPDYPSTPIDHQSVFTHNSPEGLPQKARSVGFYMTYSHKDNANFDTEWYSDGTPHDTFQQRNRQRNGWAMGWLTGETVVDEFGNVQYGAASGRVKMDIFIHNGKSRNEPDGSGYDDNYNFGNAQSDVWYGPALSVPAGGAYSTVSQSNPQVVQSNEMDLLARQDNNMMLAADYRDDTTALPQGYVYAGLNQGKYTVDGDGNSGTPVTAATLAEFNTVISSMDVREVNSYETSAGAGDDLGGVIDPIHGTDTPQALLDGGVTDGLGNPYLYEDSFFSRDGESNDGSPWVEGSTDGGVIAGLSGYDEYESKIKTPQKLTHWGEQQVIRIDFDTDTFDGIDEIIFYDWGRIHPVTGQQTDPKAIVISVDASNNLYYDKDASGGVSPGDIFFPDNRIYIAQVVPEPTTAVFLAIGGAGLIAKRRRGSTRQ